MPGLLDLLGLQPSPESLDYVQHKTQFHLHTLRTEQRHPRTMDLGFVAARDTEAALRQILSVDDDLEARCESLAAAPEPLEQMAAAIADAIGEGHRIYFYGCGATGRLAKQMESSFWRPFWRRARAALGAAAGGLPADIGDRVGGEMTGGDRALVSSLEGFEDLPQIGTLQLADHGIRRGDVVICVTEGGETSSVIGTILGARAWYGADAAAARARLFFVYNNPDEVLRPLERSRQVLDEPGIARIPLWTGPQAIAGSTRMQATTIETFVLGVVLEAAIARILRGHVPAAPLAALAALGLMTGQDIPARLRGFAAVRRSVAAAVPALVPLTEREAATYGDGRFATYFVRAAMVTVFTDCTERSPTFRLLPLDESGSERACWVQIWTEGADAAAAWRNFLGRPFRGLADAHYRPTFAAVGDPYLRRAALQSLAHAGSDQEQRYDFAFAGANVERRGPRPGDLGVLVLVDDERDALTRPGTAEHAFAGLCAARGARLAVVRAGSGRPGAAPPGALVVDLVLDDDDDPLQLRRHVAVKMLLNAHSTTVMARSGRVVGNTMTNVSPSNLKLIGRATFLIQSHVNDTIAQPAWVAAHGATPPVAYAEANAVLYDAIAFVGRQQLGQTAEVAMCIVRILESLRTGAAIDWPAARVIVDAAGLAGYLQRLDPALGRGRGGVG